MTANRLLAAALGAAILLTACNVQDPIYEASMTAHPDHGKITLTTKWDGRGTGIDIPAGYTVAMGDYTEYFTQATASPDKLFDPGTYNLRVYNQPGNPSVNGTTATANYADGTLGWLFTSVQEVSIEADKVHELTAAMQQQVRQLTLILEPSGATADKIKEISGTLSGAAGTLNFETGLHATPSDVALSFAKDTDGRWKATVRLLGVAGEEQKLSGTITFTDPTQENIPLESDLSAKLADFNTGKKEPVALDGQVELHSAPGFTAAITDWKKITGGIGIAN